MKTLVISIISAAAISVMLPGSKIMAWSGENPVHAAAAETVAGCTDAIPAKTSAPRANTISEADYPYLKNIGCIRDAKFMRSRGFSWKLMNMSPGDATHYTLQGKGNNIEMKAKYDMDGKLVESQLVKRDTKIPPAIRKYIASGQFKGWVMTGNEMVVKDFDPSRTDYTVTLSKGSSEQVLRFRDLGHTIAFLQ